MLWTTSTAIGTTLVSVLQGFDLVCGCNVYYAHDPEIGLRPKPHTRTDEDFDKVSRSYVGVLAWHKASIAVQLEYQNFVGDTPFVLNAVSFFVVGIAWVECR